MVTKNSTKKNSAAATDVKSSTKNIFLNIIIFLLGALIIYMSYAIVNKLVHAGTKKPESGQTVGPSAIIQAEVLNGCGIGGVADRFTDYLRSNKVDVVNVSNYSSFDIDHTMVIDRIGNLENAKKIASILGIKEENVIQQVNTDYFLDVSLVIGKDYNQLKPLQ